MTTFLNTLSLTRSMLFVAQVWFFMIWVFYDFGWGLEPTALELVLTLAGAIGNDYRNNLAAR